jgi:hypothetical protein
MLNRDEKSEYNRLYRIANKERIEAKRAERKAGLGIDVRRCSVSGCEGIHDTQGYCARHYMAWRRNGDPVEVRQHQIHGKTLEERVAAYTERGPGCWEWTGVRNPKGYGVLRVGEGNKLAHRLTWEHENGKIPVGISVLHRCDNPGCVRPAHLFLGTKADNSADMIAKKRHHTKLTEAQVKAIRRSSDTNTELGFKYGVSRVLVGRIRCGKAWRHVMCR